MDQVFIGNLNILNGSIMETMCT